MNPARPELILNGFQTVGCYLLVDCEIILVGHNQHYKK